MARTPTPVKVVVLRYGFSFGAKHPSPEPGDQIKIPHTSVTHLEGARIVINAERYKRDKAEYDAFIAEQRRKAGLDNPKRGSKSKPKDGGDKPAPDGEPEDVQGDLPGEYEADTPAAEPEADKPAGGKKGGK